MKIKYLNLEYGEKKQKKQVMKPFLILCLIGLVLFTIAFGVLSVKYTPQRVLDKGLVVTTDIFSPLINNVTLTYLEKTGKNDIYLNLVKASTQTINYVDNKEVNSVSSSNLLNDDVKLILRNEELDRLVNYTDGYYIDLPIKSSYDFTLSKDKVNIYNENIQITISKEQSPYFDLFEYINHYQNRFYLDNTFQKTNNITVNTNEYLNVNGKETLLLSLTRNTDNTNILSTYNYAFINTSGRNYTRVLIKSKEYNKEKILDILNTYTPIRSKGIAKYNISTFPIPNEKWTDETKMLYNKYISSNNNDVDWGIFVKDIGNIGINETLPKLENQLENKFDIILIYNHIGNDLPLTAMKKLDAQDKVIELTVQTCANNNTKLYDYTPMFDIIDGKKDAEIRKLASQIKQFNNPILFRLNNEMNSDWTSYSGIITLSDPAIYTQVWHRIYDIFDQEGVSNCIWIFNPNDKSFPPSKWNSFMSYYPGNEYVQMIGVTGYNTGTYYFNTNGEIWNDFEIIYDHIEETYLPIFGKFPWIITEFGTSSVGGDKPLWITNMFKTLPKYKNIKAAVWFNSADYDENNNIARPYWLDETPASLKAFKEGLNK